eukprot:scaffold34814_cov63-Phaeocystis_antarctica.AAC.6
MRLRPPASFCACAAALAHSARAEAVWSFAECLAPCVVSGGRGAHAAGRVEAHRLTRRRWRALGDCVDLIRASDAKRRPVIRRSARQGVTSHLERVGPQDVLAIVESELDALALLDSLAPV